MPKKDIYDSPLGKKIKRAGSETLYEQTSKTSPKKPTKHYNTYQQFNSVCLKKVNPDDSESLSHIEIVEGKELYPNEQMKACGLFWRENKNKGNGNALDIFNEKFKEELTKIDKDEKTIISMAERKRRQEVSE